MDGPHRPRPPLRPLAAYMQRLHAMPLRNQIQCLGCAWDAVEICGLSGDDALSAALSCHVSHGGGIGPRGLTGVF